MKCEEKQQKQRFIGSTDEKEMLSAQIDSWGREVEKSRKSWVRKQITSSSSSSSSSWTWLRSALPLMLIAICALGAIFFVDVDLLRGESFDRQSYVETQCHILSSSVESIECSKQSSCDVPNSCHKQIYYQCYFPIWRVRYAVSGERGNVLETTIRHEHNIYGDISDAKLISNSFQGEKTCYVNKRKPSECKWIRPNPAPFFFFMIIAASLLGFLLCCVAVDRLCNLDSRQRFVVVPSVLRHSNDPFISLDEKNPIVGNSDDGERKKSYGTSTNRAFV